MVSLPPVRVVAMMYTPQGFDAIKESPAYTGVESESQELPKLVGALLLERWEPVGFDDKGRPRTFKRQIPDGKWEMCTLEFHRVQENEK
jgi:hypothetical protein